MVYRKITIPSYKKTPATFPAWLDALYPKFLDLIAEEAFYNGKKSRKYERARILCSSKNMEWVWNFLKRNKKIKGFNEDFLFHLYYAIGGTTPLSINKSEFHIFFKKPLLVKTMSIRDILNKTKKFKDSSHQRATEYLNMLVSTKNLLESISKFEADLDSFIPRQNSDNEFRMYYPRNKSMKNCDRNFFIRVMALFFNFYKVKNSYDHLSAMVRIFFPDNCDDVGLDTVRKEYSFALQIEKKIGNHEIDPWIYMFLN